MAEDLNVPLFADLDGDVFYHIENIITKMYDGTLQKYPADKTHQTLLSNPKASLFYHSIQRMIDKCKETDGWFFAYWEENLPDNSNEKPLRQKIDLLFYDEFVFLYEEGLVRFDSVKFVNADNVEIVNVYTKKLKNVNARLGVFE